jgi:uncharacterized OB-fold protein
MNLPVVPRPRTSGTTPFWDAVERHELLLPWCDHCGAPFWYPRQFCPTCGSRELTWRASSGRGTVYAFTVVRRGGAGPYGTHVPYVVAYVELAEGPRIIANVVACSPEDVAIGMSVSIVYQRDDDGESMYRFAPSA